MLVLLKRVQPKLVTCGMQGIGLELIDQCSESRMRFLTLTMGTSVMFARLIRSKRILGLVLFFSGPTWVHSQGLTISGYVEDRLSGERIPDVAIYFPEIQRGTVANQYGFYSFVTDATKIKMLALHVAYEPQEFNFALLQDTTLDISLALRAINLEGLEVLAHPDRTVDNTQMSQHTVEISQVEKLPVLLGEPDIQKLLQLLPGVQGGQEGGSGLYVRGGRADQNLILLDGLPVYNPSHLFGFFSVFPAQAMKSVKLLKGGFPARYGGRLSSVVDYTMKEGNLREFKKQVSIGLIASRLLIEGPIKEDKASFLLSGRRTFIDLLLKPIQARSEESVGGYFYDLHFKANYIASRRDRIYLSAYAGRDLFAYRLDSKDNSSVGFLQDNAKVDLGWGNHLLALRWNRVAGDRTFVNVLGGLTTYRYVLVNKSTSQPARDAPITKSEGSWDSGIADGTIKVDVEHNAGSQHYLRFGLEGVWHRVQPGRTQLQIVGEGKDQELIVTQFPQLQIRSGTIAVYAEDDLFVNRRMQVNFGLRASAYSVEGDSYWSIEPRLSVNVRFSEHLAAKASAVTMQQYIHLLTRGGARLPNDLWVPTTQRINPQKGQQIALGLAWSALSGKYEVSLETYWRRMKRLLEYETNANAAASAILNWANLVEEGAGQALGLEIFAQKNMGRWTGWLGYTLGRSTRQFENLNGGKTFPDGFDRRHDLSIVSKYRITDRIEFSGSWVFGSGYPIWLPVGRYHTVGPSSNCTSCFPEARVDFGALNSSRAPDYHRLDVGVHIQKAVPEGTRTLSFGVYNAYGHRNPFYVYAKSGFAERKKPVPITITQGTLFRWIPSVSYQLDF